VPHPILVAAPSCVDPYLTKWYLLCSWQAARPAGVSWMWQNEELKAGPRSPMQEPPGKSLRLEALASTGRSAR
jgi:hypothetical protein